MTRRSGSNSCQKHSRVSGSRLFGLSCTSKHQNPCRLLCKLLLSACSSTCETEDKQRIITMLSSQAATQLDHHSQHQHHIIAIIVAITIIMNATTVIATLFITWHYGW